VTLTWFGIAAVGALLPMIPQITVGEVTVQLQEAEGLIDQAFSEFGDWGDCLAEYLAAMAELRESTAIDTRLRQFINLRLVEAGEWLAISDENPRISVWLEDQERHELVFAYSKEIRDEATITTPFRLDEGLVGAAYTEREIRNEINPQQHPLFKPIPGGSFYGSLLIVPINYGLEKPLGALCIDRRPARYFTEAQINVMKFIANVIGIAIGRSLEADGQSG
jgi:signal transduction protein with GAF and PtsI domain